MPPTVEAAAQGAAAAEAVTPRRFVSGATSSRRPNGGPPRRPRAARDISTGRVAFVSPCVALRRLVDLVTSEIGAHRDDIALPKEAPSIIRRRRRGSREALNGVRMAPVRLRVPSLGPPIRSAYPVLRPCRAATFNRARTVKTPSLVARLRSSGLRRRCR